MSEDASSGGRAAIPTKNQGLGKLAIAIGVNLLLGIPAMAPLGLAWVFLVNWPLAELGWTQRDPTEDDGPVAVLILIGLVLCLFIPIWGVVNVLLRRMVATRASVYWPVCVAASLVPSSLLW